MRAGASAQRLDRAVLGDAPDERPRFFAADPLHFRTGLLQDLDSALCRQVGGDHNEDTEPRLTQRRHLRRVIPDVRILREEQPSTLGDGGKQVNVFGDRCDVVVVRLDAPAELSPAGRDSATEVAVAEEDYAAGRNQSSYLRACSTST